MNVRSIALASSVAVVLSAGCSAAVAVRDAGTDLAEDVTAPAIDAHEGDVPTPTLDASVDVPRPDDGVPLDAPVIEAGGGCESLQRSLAAQLISPRDGRLTCSVVVRLDQGTLRPVGYQTFCGRYATTTEAQAREAAQREGMVSSVGTMVNPAMPEDAYVFYAPPSDFGSVTAVSVRLGRTVFGASIIWAGRGAITVPAEWRDPSELGDGCAAARGIPRARGYDLGRGVALEVGVVDRVVGAVARTAVPAALWQGGYVFDAVVFPYWRSSGGAVDTAPEWVVIVNGGWLE